MEGIIPEYTDFVKQVLARDDYTCQCCGQEHGELNVHHLNGYSWFKEGRTDPHNGITLCENCHMNFHYEYGKEKNTKEQFEEWIGKTILLDSCALENLPTARKVYCIEENKVYNSAKELAYEWNISHVSIYCVCNRKTSKRKYIDSDGETKEIITTCHTVKGKHLLWHDEYLKMTKEEIDVYIKTNVNKTYRKVICITTGKVFDTIRQAHNFYGSNSNQIIKCCRGSAYYAGTLPNGTKLQWMYYEDYIQQKDLENTDELCMENIA